MLKNMKKGFGIVVGIYLGLLASNTIDYLIKDLIGCGKTEDEKNDESETGKETEK